ncbi:hypothetical protein EES37_38200 [Streptomyces sp. ADI91-18]|nr:hypothetical protein EES37_38200 [Streptomyces sp. ADI91-18]
MPRAHGWEIRLVSRTNTREPWWSIWQAMQRKVTDLPPPVEALTRMCGDSASRSTETIRPPAPNPMIGADSLAAATSSRVLGSLKRALAGGLRVFFTSTYGLRPSGCQENVTPSRASFWVMRSATTSREKPSRVGRSMRISASSSEKFFGMWR